MEQLAGFGESKDHKTAASQLEVIEREIKVRNSSGNKNSARDLPQCTSTRLQVE